MRKILLLLLFLALLKHSGAQTPDIKFDHIGIKEGLPEDQVKSIVQDVQGYIWIGTQNGLVRYDGYNYKLYNLGSDQVNSFTNTDVASIFQDRQKVLWVSAVGSGLFRYDRNTDTFKEFKFPGSYTFSLVIITLEDNENNLWCRYQATNHSSIVKFNKARGNFEFFSSFVKGVDQINSSVLYEPYKTSDGAIWVPTSNGLYKYNGAGKGFKSYFTTADTTKARGYNPVYEAPSEPGVLWANTFHGNNKDLRITRVDLRNNTIKDYTPGNKPGDVFSAYLSTIYEDHKKELWFALDSGLAKFDRKTGKFINYIRKDRVRSNLSDILETRRGNFWLSSSSGLVYFNTATNEFKVYTGKETPGYVNNKIIDNTGQLWVGSKGVYKANYLKSAFHVYKNITGDPNSYPGGAVNISLAGNGDYWIYNTSSVYKWQSSAAKFEKVFNGKLYINSVCHGVDGMLYLGTDMGFVVYDPKTHNQLVYSHISTDINSTAVNSVRVVYRDHTGIIWVGTYNRGIYSFDPKTKKIIRYPYRFGNFVANTVNDGGLDDSNVLCIYEDKDNTLWIGTNAGGLNKFNRATNKFYSYDINPKNRKMFCVNTVCEGDSGRLWVGTYLNGLFEFDPKTEHIVRNLNERSGLLQNGVEDISKDAAGHLWIISDRGLTRYDPHANQVQNFKAVTLFPADDISYTDGLNQSRAGNGMIVFGLNDGVVIFDPKALDANPDPPIVHIEGITYSNPLSDGSAKNIIPYGINSLELAYNENRIKFDYIALHFDDPSQNRYAYKLDGYDKDWVQAGTLRSVTYTNLSPGTYTFHVKACNSDGVWNNTGDSITIIIHTSLWMRWWAWLIYMVLFAAAIYAFISYRSRALIRENQQLEEKITHRTQQLSDANKELSEQQQEIITQRDKLATTVDELKTTQQQLIQSEKLASLGELTAGIAHEIQNPLNFVNNFSEVSVELMDEMQTELKNGDKDEAIAISEDIKQNLEKIRHHGKRADAIVKNMLQHSRNNSGERQATDINNLAEEYFRLSYHGLRAKDKSFNSDMVTNLGEHIPKLDIIPQDIGRVMLNLFNNAFYAVQQRKKTAGTDYKPTVTLTTFASPLAGGGWGAEIRVKDNGTGIPDNVKEKILQPFFTTKPTGEGTGLGLSLSYDIIVKGHGGKLEIESSEGEGSEFIIYLPA